MYLKKKQVKGYYYYQLCESWREEGRKRERVLLHLGPDLEAPETLIKWWKFLGQPLIPTNRGRDPMKPAGVIKDLQKFLDLNYSRPDAQAIIKALRQLGLPSPGDIPPIHDAAPVKPEDKPGVYIEVRQLSLIDPESGQILKSGTEK